MSFQSQSYGDEESLELSSGPGDLSVRGLGFAESSPLVDVPPTAGVYRWRRPLLLGAGSLFLLAIGCAAAGVSRLKDTSHAFHDTGTARLFNTKDMQNIWKDMGASVSEEDALKQKEDRAQQEIESETEFQEDESNKVDETEENGEVDSDMKPPQDWLTDASEDKEHGSISYDGVASGNCASTGCGAYAGSCGCNSDCELQGTCCSDYESLCKESMEPAAESELSVEVPAASEPSMTMTGKDMAAAPVPSVTETDEASCKNFGCSFNYQNSCQCTKSCKTFGDCCSDFDETCAEAGGTSESMQEGDFRGRTSAGGRSESQVTESMQEGPSLKKGDDPTAGMTHEEIIAEQRARDKKLKEEKKKAKKEHKVFKATQKDWIFVLKWQAVRSCPIQYTNKDVMSGKDLLQVPNVKTGAECQKACTENRACDAFSWGAKRDTYGLSDVCFLKTLSEDSSELTFVEKDGVISGSPCCRPGDEAMESCPETIMDIDLTTNRGLKSLNGVTSVHECQKACTDDSNCGAFTWGAKPYTPGLSDVCFLKQLASDEAPNMKAKDGVISGLPCGCRATVSNAIWPQTKAEKFAMPAPKRATAGKPGSMLCIALVVPYSYEQGILVEQFNSKVGIFACDEFAVYSNQLMELAPGFNTRLVLSSQRCEKGGEFRTALNLDIFTAVWRQVVADGDYHRYNWIIKADPDTVFFPHRLRPLLWTHEEGAAGGGGTGVYLNNCKYGLHGPIEVFSQNAVAALAMGFQGCFRYFEKLCKGDCQWGEDMWIDQCLKRRVNSTRVNEYNLLAEDHCDPVKGWESCENVEKVSFHPFKSVEKQLQCQQNAAQAEQAVAR